MPRWLLSLLVFVVAVAVYLPNLANSWAWDDDYLVVDNPAVHSFSGAAGWFSDPWSAGTRSKQGRRQNALYWRPLTQASYALDWVLSGGRPWLFHLTNNLLHGLATVLVSLLALLFGGKLGWRQRPVMVAALCAGLLFALHPVHTEAVNLITYRTTLLAAVFVLGGIYLHCAGRGWPSALLAALCLALGLMSKESAVILLAWAPLCDLALRRWRELGRWQLARRYAPLVVVTVAYLVLHRSLTGPPQLDFFVGATTGQIFLTMMKVIGLYVRLMIIPHPLTPFYDWSIFPVATTFLDLEVITGALLLLLLGGLLLLSLLRRRVILALTIGLFLAALLPFMHLLPFFDVAGERFIYLASTGACVGAGLGLGHALERGFRRPILLGLCAVAALIGLVFGALTVARTPHFASTHTLLEATTRRFPGGFAAHYYLGRSWLDRRQPGRAVAPLRRAHAIMPGIEPCTLALAEALELSGRRAEARAVLERAVRKTGSPALLRRLEGSR